MAGQEKHTLKKAPVLTDRNGTNQHFKAGKEPDFKEKCFEYASAKSLAGRQFWVWTPAFTHKSVALQGSGVNCDARRILPRGTTESR